MDPRYLVKNLEVISEKVHQAWMAEKIAQGFHSPEECPNVDATDDTRTLMGKFQRKCAKCHTDLYPYNELPENIKAYNRVTVLAVIDAIKQLE